MPLSISRVLRIATVLLAVAAPASIASVTPAFAKYQEIQLAPEQAAAVQRISDFINSFQSLKGDFVQISPRGNTTRGVMLISKPGKLRFEYEPPNPLLIVADGTWLTITNKEKTKGDQVPLSSTPLRFIVEPGVDLLRDAAVISFEQNEGITSVALAEKSGNTGGYITLVFDDAKNELQQWIITDGKGQRTTVQFGNFERDIDINPKLFAVKITRKQKDN